MMCPHGYVSWASPPCPECSTSSSTPPTPAKKDELAAIGVGSLEELGGFIAGTIETTYPAIAPEFQRDYLLRMRQALKPKVWRIVVSSITWWEGNTTSQELHQLVKAIKEIEGLD